MSNFMKIPSAGADLFYAEDGQTDRRTDMTKLRVVFRNFSNAPNTVSTWSYTRCYLTLKGRICVTKFWRPAASGVALNRRFNMTK